MSGFDQIALFLIALTANVFSAFSRSAALLAGSFAGGYLGAHWAIVKGNRRIKRGFELVTLLVGVKLILG